MDGVRKNNENLKLNLRLYKDFQYKSATQEC